MKVVSGDSTRADAWSAALGKGPADALLTDPPYCLLTRRRKKGDLRQPKGKKNEGPEVRRFESVREYRDFTQGWMRHAAAFTRPEATWVVWTNLLGKAPILECAAELGWHHLWGEFTWAKRTREANSGEELLRVVEVALVLARTPLPALSDADPPRCWAAVAGYDDDGEAKRWGSHPNHKPFGVLEPLVRQWTRPGQRVIDPFAGSGSIPMAAEQLGREAACIELSGEWVERIGVRARAAAGAKP